jgi:hypothetical protein
MIEFWFEFVDEHVLQRIRREFGGKGVHVVGVHPLFPDIGPRWRFRRMNLDTGGPAIFKKFGKPCPLAEIRDNFVGFRSTSARPRVLDGSWLSIRSTTTRGSTNP